jgi:ATP-dependent Clp protease ATP-binding subunit ClpB
MRIDKLTTKFQEALADAQSLAAGRDNQYIEPVHVLAALVAQQDGSARSLMSRAGVRAGAARRAQRSDLAPAAGDGHRRRHPDRPRTGAAEPGRQGSAEAGDTFIASEMFLLAVSDDKGEAGKLARSTASRARRSKPRSPRCAAARKVHSQDAESARR